jgi:hypothetical protein
MFFETIPLFKQVETRFDPEYGVLWGFMNPVPRLVSILRSSKNSGNFVRSIDEPRGKHRHDGVDHAIHYA